MQLLSLYLCDLTDRLGTKTDLKALSMNYDEELPSLREECLPRDWYPRYSKRLLQGYVDYLWEGWPLLHRHCLCRQGYVQNLFRDNDDILDGTSPKELSLGSAYPFFNKTAIFYLAFGGSPEKNWRENERKFPVCWEPWLEDAYDSWARECEPRERLDARFVFALRHFSKQDDKRVQTWIGLGEGSGNDLDQDKDIERLIHWHNEFCDRIQARAKAPLSPEDERNIDGWWTTDGISRRAKAYHSTLAPTCRAVLGIARNPMPSTRHVLLVLTGHNEDLLSGAPTFDSIPLEDIVVRRSNTIVEVSLQTAIRYLQLLERKEESANAAFRERNDQRREAIYEDVGKRSQHELEEIRAFSGTLGGRRARRGRRRRRRPVYLTSGFNVIMEASWKLIVADEYNLACLANTTALRRTMHEEDTSTRDKNEAWRGSVKSWGESARSLIWSFFFKKIEA